MKIDKTGCVDTYDGKGYFIVRPNWEGKGYRLYFGDDKTCSQIDGEINGKVFPTIKAAKENCLNRYKETAVYERS